MKNRHRVSQVVNKLICSRRFGCQLRDVYVGATYRGQHCQAAGAIAQDLICERDQRSNCIGDLGRGDAVFAGQVIIGARWARSAARPIAREVTNLV